MDIHQLFAAFTSAFTQAQRLVTLHLADASTYREQLLPQSVTGAEALSQPFRYEVTCLSPDVGLELKSRLGLPAELGTLTTEGDSAVRCGVVPQARALPADDGFARSGLTIKPPLAHRRASRIFRDLAMIEIVQQVLNEPRRLTDCFFLTLDGTHR
ncbi:contractile injection system protein, VgrG/Pvc8 family [Chitiniphilus eburneus]|uniref:Type VI secretion system tip protein VgrG n=1 Tax=Chitiniphilus eburneus TaxID=2571148 RepID=A0A4U0Q8F5_9NEIS|nr:contractile injection system protein, VgrG/Pvc8 family [Chitiniphilus eburneus]TJZ77539.1 hypothetical protein FAZ21_04210 [Chitiniphilus eburneus]